MSAPATLQDVAEKAGVHRSTVSLALRDNPRISADVRSKIQRIARELGYRSNPLVTALMRSRRTRRAPRHVVLAYVTDYPTRYGWRPPHHDRPDYFPGAAARAIELGYKLEHFWLGEPGMTAARFAHILSSRGINGLLVGRLPPGKSEIHLPWEQFSAVALGLTLSKPDLHRVAEDAFASAAIAMDHCLAKGFRRIGFVMSEPDDSPNMGDRWLGAYLRLQLRLLPENRIPYCEYRAAEEFPAHFLRWFETHRPDVVLATHGDPVVSLLAGSGARRLQSTQVFLLVNDKPQEGLAGMHLDPGIVGALAVDMLVGMMHRGETGLPTEPHHVLVPGVWMETRSAAAIPAPAPRAKARRVVA
jgi:DNA-binding LacI/PurR family transcriptional regulator